MEVFLLSSPIGRCYRVTEWLTRVNDGVVRCVPQTIATLREDLFRADQTVQSLTDELAAAKQADAARQADTAAKMRSLTLQNNDLTAENETMRASLAKLQAESRQRRDSESQWRRQVTDLQQELGTGTQRG